MELKTEAVWGNVLWIEKPTKDAWVNRLGVGYRFSHERQIPEEWPEDVKKQLTKFIQSKRELEGDETWSVCKKHLCKMLLVDGVPKLKFPDGSTVFLTGRRSRPERQAFIDRHSKPRSLTEGELEQLYLEHNGLVAARAHHQRELEILEW